MTYASLKSTTPNVPRCTSESIGAPGGDFWLYADGDDLAAVTAIGYIRDAAELGLVAGDTMLHRDTTNNINTWLTAVAGATTGTAAGALGSAIEPVGETSIVLQSAGTGTFIIGDMIRFGTDGDNTYRVTTGDADISGGGTLVITPGLVNATAVGETITIVDDVINLSPGLTGGVTTADTPSTHTLTTAQSGSTLLFDAAAGQAFTLPAPVVGLEYTFVVTVDLTSNAYSVVTDAATTFLVGSLNGAIEGAATGEVHFANGSTHVGLSMNKTTTGGLIGGVFTLKCISSTLWQITGNTSCTATPATPFTT